MVPLGYFLIAWLVLLAFYAVFVLITLIQMLRHGLPSPFTYLSTFIFIAVIAAVVLGCGMYFLNVDWDQTIHVLSGVTGLFFKDSGLTGGEAPLDIPL